MNRVAVVLDVATVGELILHSSMESVCSSVGWVPSLRLVEDGAGEGTLYRGGGLIGCKGAVDGNGSPVATWGAELGKRAV